MPLQGNIEYRYRILPKKDGKERRQRLAFERPSNKVVEAQTQQKEREEWVPVKGSDRARSYTRRL